MLERYVYSGGKRMRCGYTTGSCAAAAAKAAAEMLLSGTPVSTISINTPKGVRLDLDVEDAQSGDGWASCAVRKDAGDDIDVTNGLLIYARVDLTDEEGIKVDGGDGVGRVTRKGLEQPVGAAAINRVPRMMIAREVRGVLEQHGCKNGVAVAGSIPRGREIASQTYNPRLGIEGGISVLGTTGIVEPMSQKALVDTIEVELNMLRAGGAEAVLVTPGNYGEVFSRESMKLPLRRSVLCSNFIGETLDHAAQLGFEGLLLVGHVGKLVKLAGGIFNTHSRVADARAELFAAHALLAGADRETAVALLSCITTDEAVDLLDAAGILEQTMRSIIERIELHIQRRAGSMPVGVVVFSNTRGILGQTSGAAALIEQIKLMEEPK